MVDVDGVLCDITGSTCDFAVREGYILESDKQEALQYEPIDSPDDRMRQAAEAFLVQPELVEQCAILEGAAEGLRVLHENGYKVHLASARYGGLFDATLRWLRTHNLESYVTLAHRRPQEMQRETFKRAVCRMIKAAAVFEDHPTTILHLANRGFKVFPIQQPWNFKVWSSDANGVSPATSSLIKAVHLFIEDTHVPK